MREISDYDLFKGDGPRWYEGIYIKSADKLQYIIAPLPVCWLRKVWFWIRSSSKEFMHRPSYELGYRAGFNKGKVSVYTDLDSQYQRDFGRSLF